MPGIPSRHYQVVRHIGSSNSKTPPIVQQVSCHPTEQEARDYIPILQEKVDNCGGVVSYHVLYRGLPVESARESSCPRITTTVNIGPDGRRVVTDDENTIAAQPENVY